MTNKTPPVPIPEPAPVIIEENLSGLPFLRNLVTGLFFDWDADKGDSDTVNFILSLKQVFLEPLVNFDKAYDLFIKHCTDSKQAHIVGDLWRVFQMIIWTELDKEMVSTMTAFTQMAQRVMGEAPGGNELYPRKLKLDNSPSVGFQPHEVKTPFDYLVLLAVRIYCAGIRGPSQPKQGA